MIALMVAAAASLTAHSSTPHNPDGVVSHEKGATHAYMFSRKRLNAYYWSNQAPPVVCVPEQPKVLVVTDVVPLGKDLASYLKKYPDATTESIGDPGKIITLNNPDGTWKVDISSQIDQKILPEDHQSRANVESCILHLTDTLNKIYPEPDHNVITRQRTRALARTFPKRVTPTS